MAEYTFKRGDTPGAVGSQLGTDWRKLTYVYPNGTVVKGADLDPTKVPIGTVAYTEYSGESTEPASESSTTTGNTIELNGVPGTPQVWKIGDKTYVVYTVPDTEPPIYLKWLVPEGDIEALYGPEVTPTYNKILTEEEANKLGVIDFGTTNELANYDEDPFTSWTQTMETQAAVQPWIMDDDYQALIAMAMLEGRELTEAEIQSTEWWQTHSQAEREWMKLYHGDPQTAQQRLEDNRIRTRQALLDAGVENPTDEVINYIADQVTMGHWSTTDYQQQIRAISDPYSEIPIDPGLSEVIGEESMGRTQEGEEQVRNMVREYLGPVHGKWSDEQIAEWAGRIRNDPDAQTQLIADLRQQRLALFPEYEDESLTYENIAQPWRSFGQNMWGQQMDETDPLFATMLRNNDAQKNAELLRREGMKREIGTVEQSLRQDILQATGGSVRRVL